MLLPLNEVNFRYPVKLTQGASKSLWNDRACVGTDMYLDTGGAVPKLLLTKAGDDDVIRVIPYHAIQDFSIEGGLSLPREDE